MPRVSISMPAYNAGRFISEAIESCLSQSLTDFELLIHDDGSTDNTLEIARSYEAKDPRIRVTTSTNCGAAVTRNKLIDASQGEYVAVQDADDVSLPARLELQVQFLDAHPDHVLVGGQIEWMEEDGLVIGPVHTVLNHEDIEARHLQLDCRMAQTTVMMRRNALQKVGGYDHDFAYAEDFDLWLRLGEVGKLANLPQAVARYRLVGSSLSNLYHPLQVRDAWRALNAAKTRRGLEIDPHESAPAPNGEPLQRASWRRTIQFGWIAWGAGRRQSWRHFALRALREAPNQPASWRLLVVGAFKRPPGGAQNTAPD